MKKIILIFILAVLLVGCVNNDVTNRQEGLTINSTKSSIGKVDETTDKQRFRYSIIITNNDKSDFEIISVKPILSNEFEKLAILDNHKLILNKNILKGESLEINGEIIFNSSDLTKKEILDLEPFIKEFEIIEKRIIKKEM
ncbi:MAG: hypothetical protein ACQEQE_04970 [Bacillota bacterium]